MRRFLTFAVAISILLPASFAVAQTAEASFNPALATPSAASERSSVFNGFDEWVREIMEQWNVPGLAVGAIKDGEVVLLEGYGYRDIENQLPVTPTTLMAIGSNSKSFTVVLMGQLVDEEKLDWDKPLIHYMPDFQLQDDYATKHMRVEDIVTHVSGLPRHDALWYGRSFDREEMFSRLRYLEPTTSFRGRWQYQNLMFMTAGLLLERMTGETWDDLIHEKIFRPLGMNRSNTTVTKSPQADDFAYPYVSREGELTKVPFRNIDNVGPAGSINSSVEEMLPYIQMHISKGEYNGTRILSEENEVLMQSAQSVVGSPDLYPELGPATYGLALSVTSYRGHKMVGHGGGIDGFISAMGWLPNDEIGVMVLTNMSGEANPVPTIVQRRVFDDLLGLEPVDWNARSAKQVEEGLLRAEEQRKKREAERVAGTSPSHSLSDYAGTYEHAGYGVVEISENSGTLRARYDQFMVDLKHFHYDTFEVDAGRDMVPLEGRVQFLMDSAGKVNRLEIPFESNVAPIVFVRNKTN